MVVTWVWCCGHMTGVLGHTKHTCRVWGEGGRCREVGMGWGAVQVRGFVVVGMQLIAAATLGQGGSSGWCVVMALAEVVTIMSEAVR